MIWTLSSSPARRSLQFLAPWSSWRGETRGRPRPFPRCKRSRYPRPIPGMGRVMAIARRIPILVEATNGLHHPQRTVAHPLLDRSTSLKSRLTRDALTIEVVHTPRQQGQPVLRGNLQRTSACLHFSCISGTLPYGPMTGVVLSIQEGAWEGRGSVVTSTGRRPVGSHAEDVCVDPPAATSINSL